MNKTYSQLISIDDYIGRYEYLKEHSFVGEETFGSRRYLNQILYNTTQWKTARGKAIIRDSLGGDYCLDMAMPGKEIRGMIIVHHINPITVEDILQRNPMVFDLENLVCVSPNTHKAIHYGDSNLLIPEMIIRTPNDTIPWRQ